MANRCGRGLRGWRSSWRGVCTTAFSFAARNAVDAANTIGLALLLRGPNIVLRPLQTGDVEGVVETQAEAGVARWWGAPDGADLQRLAEGRGEEEAFVIEREGELVGFIQFTEESDPEFRHAGIDLFISERHHGKGLGTDAIRTLARYLIGERGHHRLTIDPAADNAVAIRAYERVGFRPVGVLREYWRAPDGTWRDELLMDLLARELDPE